TAGCLGAQTRKCTPPPGRASAPIGSLRPGFQPWSWSVPSIPAALLPRHVRSTAGSSGRVRSPPTGTAPAARTTRSKSPAVVCPPTTRPASRFLAEPLPRASGERWPVPSIAPAASRTSAFLRQRPLHAGTIMPGWYPVGSPEGWVRPLIGRAELRLYQRKRVTGEALCGFPRGFLHRGLRVRFSIMPRYTLETIIIVLVILTLTQHSCYV